MLGGALAVSGCGNAADGESTEAELAAGCDSGRPDIAALSPNGDQDATICVTAEGDGCAAPEDEALGARLRTEVGGIPIAACTDCDCNASLIEVECGAWSEAQAKCCYDVVVSVYEHCGKGRDLVIDGELRTAPPAERSDWMVALDDALPVPSDAARATLAALWTRDGLLEHASVAAFARFTLEAMVVGAPAEIVRAIQVAAADEVRHAELCFALAARHAGRPVGPGQLAVGRRLELRDSLAEIAAATVIEGCVGETISAFRAMASRDLATDPMVRGVLSCIGRDEAKHAELAWRFVAWAVERGGDEVARAVAEAFDRGEEMARAARASLLARSDGREDAALAAELEAHGRLPRRADVGVRDEVWQHVIRPAARAVLALSLEFSSRPVGQDEPRGQRKSGEPGTVVLPCAPAAWAPPSGANAS
jgi:hypothetical protein